MRTSDFDYELPQERIAQYPAAERDQAQLLVLHRGSGQIEHRRFPDLLDYLSPGDVLVLNDSKVVPARLHGVNARTAGQFEVLLLEEAAPNEWWVMLRPGKRAKIGTQIIFSDLTRRLTKIRAEVIDTNAEGHRRLRFSGTANISKELDRLGETPLPPYIQRQSGEAREEDRLRYQTVFAAREGSVAAPTAGLHFTTQMLERIRARGVRDCFLTLHVGLGTFAPVKNEIITHHVMHEERYQLGEEAVRIINEANERGGRVFAVGTTSVRVLESVAVRHGGRLAPESGKTRIFIHPPHGFKIVKALLTNFHLPRSTLLMLVSAFAAPLQTNGHNIILAAYAEAIRLGYRFFSYGDAMLLV
jgi:S-adenosylmethionine:tRNA ribosyltransferase-isomerase